MRVVVEGGRIIGEFFAFYKLPGRVSHWVLLKESYSGPFLGGCKEEKEFKCVELLW